VLAGAVLRGRRAKGRCQELQDGSRGTRRNFDLRQVADLPEGNELRARMAAANLAAAAGSIKGSSSPHRIRVGTLMVPSSAA